jgi:hypothetical protein
MGSTISYKSQNPPQEALHTERSPEVKKNQIPSRPFGYGINFTKIATGNFLSQFGVFCTIYCQELCRGSQEKHHFAEMYAVTSVWCTFGFARDGDMASVERKPC